MAPKAKAGKKDKEKEEQERLQKEKEDAEREEAARLQREKDARDAEEAYQREQEKLRRLPGRFRLRVSKVGWKTDNIPGRYGHFSFNVDGQLFVCGGSAKEGNSIAYILDLASKRWTTQQLGGDIPQNTLGTSCVYYEGYIYLYGGYGPKGFKDTLYRLDIGGGSFQWEKVKYGGEAPQFYSMSTILAMKFMIVFGGRSSTQLLSQSCHLLDLENMVWHEIQTTGSVPSPRFGHSAVVRENIMYLYGGIDTLGSFEPTDKKENGNTMYCLNLEDWEWQAITFGGRGPNLNRKIYGHACTVIKNGIAIVHGNFNDKIYVLRLDTKTWVTCSTVGEDLFLERTGHTAVAYDTLGSIFVFGGQQRRLNDTYNDTWHLHLLSEDAES